MDLTGFCLVSQARNGGHVLQVGEVGKNLVHRLFAYFRNGGPQNGISAEVGDHTAPTPFGEDRVDLAALICTRLKQLVMALE